MEDRDWKRLTAEHGPRERAGDFPLVLQGSETDCGPSCAAMIARHYGVAGATTDLRSLFTGLEEGTSLARIADVLEYLGLRTLAYELDESDLREVREPFVTSRGFHFVVVLGVSGDRVRLADPATGFREMPTREFAESWNRLCVFAVRESAGVSMDTSGKRRIDFRAMLERFGGILAIGLGVSLFSAAITMLLAYLGKWLFDTVIPGGDTSLLGTYLMALAAVTVLSRAIETVRDFAVMAAATRLHVSFSSDLYRHLLSIPYLRLATRLSGDVLGRMRDVASVRAFVTDHFLDLAVNVVLFVAAAVFFLFVNPKMALFALFAGLGSVGISLASARFLYARNQEIFAQSALGEQIIIEHTRNFLIFKCFGAEGASVSRWARQMEKTSSLVRAMFRLTKLLDVGFELVSLAGTAGLTLFGAYLVMRHELTLGWLVSMGTLYAMVVNPLHHLAGLVSELQSVRASRDRLEEVLALPPETSTPNAPAPADGSVRFEQVSFSYDVLARDDSRALEELSFSIPDGQVVGLVGPSGSGKTTLALLVNRVLDGHEGDIQVGGVNTRDADPRRLRAWVGIVPQNPSLIEGSILENIGLGDPQPDLAKARLAAERAQAAGFIDELPRKFDFRLGQDGLGLSGGQKQRLAVARALYRDPKVLIFDEMTSALDRNIERLMLASLETALIGRTVLVISHRLSSLRLCSRVLFLHEGRLKADGSVEELLRTHAPFRELMTDELT